MKKIKYIFILVFSFYLINVCYALTGAKYLIITPDEYFATLQPLADWKTQKGVKAMVVPLSVTGNSASQIKTYITNAYNTWDIRPQYILLAGFSVPVSGNTDDYYANITGDYHIELSIGRFPATTVSQMENIVAKSLALERAPYASGDSNWLVKGTTIVREDGSSTSDPIYWANARYIQRQWINYRYAQTDSFSKDRGHTSSDVLTAINNGRLFVVYRGQGVSNWWSPFAMTPDNLSNNSKTPIVISGTCTTMSLSSSGSLGNLFLNAGTSSAPKGAVAFFGTTSSGSGIAQYRGAVAEGFFRAVFEERTFCLGDAAKRGKFYMDSLYTNSTRYAEWNLFGDPELTIWTERPIQLTVTHDTIIYALPQNFSVLVSRYSTPISNAYVCIMMDTIIYQQGYTNASGIVNFSINPQSTGVMTVTVTSHNFLPYEKDVRIRPGNLDHDVGVVSIIEPHGSISVGTNVIPKVKIKNFGNLPDSFPVTFKIGSVYEQTITSVSLASGDTMTISFPAWNAVGGYHLVKSFTGLSNDQWRSNDSAFGSVTVILANDVGVEAITSPDSSQLINISFSPKARIKNYGSLTQTNFSAICSIVGATGVLRYSNTQTISSISPNDTVQVNFSSWVPNVIERCTVKVRTNLIGDEYPGNDRMIKIITMHSTFQIQIGYASTNARTEPFDRYYNYNTHEAIYLQSEIGAAGLITQIGYFKESGSNIDPISPVTIYMKHTTDATLTSGAYSLTGYTQVYNGEFTNNASSGWMEIQLTTPFQYNNTSNLAILILKGMQSYLSSGYPNWRYTATTNYQTRGARSDASQPNTLTQTYQRPNIRLLVTTLPGIEQCNLSSLLSQTTILYAPKPNPVINGIAHISFSIAEPTKVSLKIYDASGRIVRTLVNNQQLITNNYSLTWNGKDDNNRTIAEGIYFYTLETPKQTFTKKMVFTR